MNPGPDTSTRSQQIVEIDQIDDAPRQLDADCARGALASAKQRHSTGSLRVVRVPKDRISIWPAVSRNASTEPTRDNLRGRRHPSSSRWLRADGPA